MEPLRALAEELLPGCRVINFVDDSILPQLAENGGDVAAVKAAVDSVKEDPPCEVVETAVISNPSQEMNEIVEMFISRRKK